MRPYVNLAISVVILAITVTIMLLVSSCSEQYPSGPIDPPRRTLTPTQQMTQCKEQPDMVYCQAACKPHPELAWCLK